MRLTHVVTLAAALAGVSAIVLRAAWYSGPFFRWVWSRVSPAVDSVGAQLPAPRWRVHATVGLSYIVTALVFTLLARVMGADTAARGAAFGMLLWLGFVFPSLLLTSMFAQRTTTAFLIDVLFNFAYLTIIGAIVGALL